jgi:hypothetical protein
MGAYTLNATTIKPIVKDLVDAIDRNTQALLALASINALSKSSVPVLSEKDVAKFVMQIATQFAKP